MKQKNNTKEEYPPITKEDLIFAHLILFKRDELRINTIVKAIRQIALDTRLKWEDETK